MTEEQELREKIRQNQDDSWVAGYSAGQDGLAAEPPQGVSWPSHWRIGHAAGVEDAAQKQKATPKAEKQSGKRSKRF